MSKHKHSVYKGSDKYSIYYMRYFDYFYRLATNRYIWTGLPGEIVDYKLEQYLTDTGSALFFMDDGIHRFAVTPVNTSGNIDIYGMGDRRQAYSINYFKDYDKRNSVLLHDNTTGYPVVDYLMMFADSCANIRLTRDINVFAQRTPITFAGDSSQRLTVQNLFKQYNDFIPFINVNNSALGLDQLKVLQTGAPWLANELHVLLKQEIAQCLTFLGYHVVDSSKKERLVSDETRAQNGESDANRNQGLRLRQRSADQINRMFGLNVSVKFNEDEGVGISGDIYDTDRDVLEQLSGE